MSQDAEFCLSSSASEPGSFFDEKGQEIRVENTKSRSDAIQLS